jgi:hypothetical protein
VSSPDLDRPSFVNSLKLAAVAFVIVVPLSIIGGTFPAFGAKPHRPGDTITGVSFTAIPEFVTAIASFFFRPLARLVPVRDPRRRQRCDAGGTSFLSLASSPCSSAYRANHAVERVESSTPTHPHGVPQGADAEGGVGGPLQFATAAADDRRRCHPSATRSAGSS